MVIGASGFLGSHVTRQLVERGDDVRVLLRRTSSTKPIDDLNVERQYGDVFDDDALRAAMTGCDEVFYCVVDTRAWLRDPGPLFRTNVEGLQHVLDAAVDADLHRFVFTSSIDTIGIRHDGRPATEADAMNWADKGGGYIRSRVDAENLMLRYAAERGLPAVALCVANTYRPGERYIISERFMSARELYETAAAAGGSKPPRFGIPLPVTYAQGYAGDAAATLLRRDMGLSTLSVRLMHIMSPMDHGKAGRELGWQPEPVQEAIRRAAHWYRDYRRRAAATTP